MFSRSVISTARRAATSQSFRPIARRAFSASIVVRGGKHAPAETGPGVSMNLADIKSSNDLFGPGAQPGTVPTDLEQATGLERLEILGKMEGYDAFNMKPLDASRLGTMENPILAQGFGEEHYVGCTGFPADSHLTMWLTLSRTRPIERCTECGNVIKLDYVGPADAHNDAPEDPKTMADFVKKEYWYN
ncbi:mitochondrial cytochrome c oxidase subunit 4 [Drechslerella stenobrocha 248]|uniref:Cytochrome c oxidase subunit 4, mitochondrial n=1 Tax=Drechslerella stenobrocha 248 TaxID=1043628 RepID=W7I4B0_9PEZI|nr:mitochondrial cytochrome c oxidase subunit 4 [Drechslerella stenobrocha 248]